MRVDIRQVSPLAKWMIRFLVSTSFILFLFTKNARWQRTKLLSNTPVSSFKVLGNSIWRSFAWRMTLWILLEVSKNKISS